MESSDSVLAVDILSYDDHRTFLKAYFDPSQKIYRKSLRRIASEAGFRSPSILSMITSGRRRLTVSSAEKLAKAFSFTGRRRLYFLMLAKKDSSESLTQKKECEAKLVRLKNRVEEQMLERPQHRLLRLWYVPVVYALLGNSDLKTDARTLAKRLIRVVSTRAIESALKDLQELGLIEFINGTWRQSKSSLKTSEDANDASIFRYHEQMISLAKSALKLPSEDRDISALTVAIPKNQLPLVKSKIRQFRKEINEYLGQFSDGEVYQFNIQVFPLTRPLLEVQEK